MFVSLKYLEKAFYDVSKHSDNSTQLHLQVSADICEPSIQVSLVQKVKHKTTQQGKQPRKNQ